MVMNTPMQDHQAVDDLMARIEANGLNFEVSEEGAGTPVVGFFYVDFVTVGFFRREKATIA